ncbi:hypothetical protein BGP_5577 [Beggiatoa sp. PS]|nr:hypothetical protein BGP_5577 [Beggiatoa sp. PS]
MIEERRILFLCKSLGSFVVILILDKNGIEKRKIAKAKALDSKNMTPIFKIRIIHQIRSMLVC